MDENHLSDKFANAYKRPPPIIGSVQERCVQSLYHIASGLDCLQYFHQPEKENNSKQQHVSRDDEEVPMAKPFEPIPMPYSSLNDSNTQSNSINLHKTSKKSKKRKDKTKKKIDVTNDSNSSVSENAPNALLLKNKAEAQPLPTWQDFNDDHVSWKKHFKILLYEKAELVYATLAEQCYLAGNYGASLRNLGLLVRCHQILCKLYHSANTLMEDCLLGRAGDCCIMIVQTWPKVETYQNELKAFSDEDEMMKIQLEKDEQAYNISYIDCNLRSVLIYNIRTIEQMIINGKI